jgi:antitoxin component YwqK of YwqJK toxin-antitoxin module
MLKRKASTELSTSEKKTKHTSVIFNGKLLYTNFINEGLFNNISFYDDSKLQSLYLKVLKGRIKINNNNMCITGYIQMYKDQLIYEGNIINNIKCGFGTSYRNNKKVYSGEWRLNIPNIHGIYYNENGYIKYIGKHKEGLYHGQGVLFYDSGKPQFVCCFNNCIPVGDMIEFYENGEVKYVGKYENRN